MSCLYYLSLGLIWVLTDSPSQFLFWNLSVLSPLNLQKCLVLHTSIIHMYFSTYLVKSNIMKVMWLAILVTQHLALTPSWLNAGLSAFQQGWIQGFNLYMLVSNHCHVARKCYGGVVLVPHVWAPSCNKARGDVLVFQLWHFGRLANLH